jgi:hypothetical protein
MLSSGGDVTRAHDRYAVLRRGPDLVAGQAHTLGPVHRDPDGPFGVNGPADRTMN